MCARKLEDTQELSVHVKIRNNVLWHAIYDVWPSKAEFCRQTGFNSSEISAWITLREAPYNDVGNYWPRAIRLADFLGISPCELFPSELYAHKIEERIAEVEMSPIRVRMLRRMAGVIIESESQSDDARCALASHPSDDDVERSVQHAELVCKIHIALLDLPVREREVIEMRFGLGGHESHTLEEVGQYFCVTREEVRQREAKALRKLRHPSFAKYLRQCLD